MERFENFHIQVKFNCKEIIEYLFIHIPNNITIEDLEIFKTFGDIIPLNPQLFEIYKQGYFRMMIPIGKKDIHVAIDKDAVEESYVLIVNAIDLMVNNNYSDKFVNSCDENAIKVNEGKLRIDRNKCTFCLNCLNLN